MPTLIDLVRFRADLLNKISRLADGLPEFIDEKSVMIKMLQINNVGVNYDDDIYNAINKYQQLTDQVEFIANDLSVVVKRIEQQIDEAAAILSCTGNPVTNIASPIVIFNEKLDNLIKVRIRQYGDWHYPGLQLNTYNKSLIDCMVVCDPLYLVAPVDISPITSQYSELYQSRLRIYNNEQLDILPQSQFGFVLSWNMIEFLTVDEARTQLTQVFDLLRPGGVFMFSYNNCDLESSAQLAETKKLAYNNARIIQNICEQIGYEIINLEDGFAGGEEKHWISWAEIRKPGELVTSKLHQPLGIIVPK